MKLVVQELVIHAPAAEIYRMLVVPHLFAQWMAVDAILDPVVGGAVRWTHANGDTCSGRYLELVPDRRVVFTYGWERTEVGIPPGSTTVEIDLVTDGPASTLLKLVHRGLDDDAAAAHHGGWIHYLGRLCALARGVRPGPDPLADRRVPSFASDDRP
ncbi:SRPBCC family protein [Pseudonocardia sp. CA-142604]|uniref:SRPBCC family protein n=1 Tax=Pseudonocardia sp. CA-142604 TaxID=3240024 RepID=UPI003D94EAAD